MISPISKKIYTGGFSKPEEKMRLLRKFLNVIVDQYVKIMLTSHRIHILMASGS